MAEYLGGSSGDLTNYPKLVEDRDAVIAVTDTSETLQDSFSILPNNNKKYRIRLLTSTASNVALTLRFKLKEGANTTAFTAFVINNVAATGELMEIDAVIKKGTAETQTSITYWAMFWAVANPPATAPANEADVTIAGSGTWAGITTIEVYAHLSSAGTVNIRRLIVEEVPA